MKTSGFFQRSELTQTLWTFRREFLVVGVFSMVANVLMLSPTLYMLQVFDRVMSSRSELTLLAMSLITLFLFLTAPVSANMIAKAHIFGEKDVQATLPEAPGGAGWATLSDRAAPEKSKA